MAGEAECFLVSGKLPIEIVVLKAAPKLKRIQRTGMGVDMFDMEALNVWKIPMYVNVGVNSY